MVMNDRSFLLSDLEVLRLRGSQGTSTDEHVHWNVGYAPEAEPHLPPTMRVVIGDLHVGGKNGYADITVGSLFIHNGDELSEENMAEAVGESIAAETLYDFARSHVVGLLALLKVEVDVPIKSPDPEVTVLHKASEHDDDGTDSEEVDSGEHSEASAIDDKADPKKSH